MSLLTTENLTLSFGDFDLFRGVSVSIANDSKIGLIGANGVGKTSLLLILAGINQATSGKVTVARNRRIGYLRQEAMDTFASRDNSVFAEMLTVFDDLRIQQHRLNSLEEEMAQENCSDEVMEAYGELQQVFESAGGYDFELRIQQRFGFGKKYLGYAIEPSEWGAKNTCSSGAPASGKACPCNAG
jgi:ATP-binding cassette subfamily F protein 3